MQQQSIKADIATYNRVINACQNGGNWQLALDLMTELTAAGLKPDDITYHCVIDALHAANQHKQAEEMYLEMLQRGLTLSHWSTRRTGMLDFHGFTEGMAAAAMRIVLRDMVSPNATARTSSVHPIANDLHIITGHGTGEGKQGSVLQPLIMNMLKQLRIDCSIDARNKDRVIVKSGALQELAARVAAMHQKRKK
jgi:pentatricopeptide repeat protein